MCAGWGFGTTGPNPMNPQRIERETVKSLHAHPITGRHQSHPSNGPSNTHSTRQRHGTARPAAAVGIARPSLSSSSSSLQHAHSAQPPAPLPCCSSGYHAEFLISPPQFWPTKTGRHRTKRAWASDGIGWGWAALQAIDGAPRLLSSRSSRSSTATAARARCASAGAGMLGSGWEQKPTARLHDSIDRPSEIINIDPLSKPNYSTHTQRHRRSAGSKRPRPSCGQQSPQPQRSSSSENAGSSQSSRGGGGGRPGVADDGGDRLCCRHPLSSVDGGAIAPAAGVCGKSMRASVVCAR